VRVSFLVDQNFRVRHAAGIGVLDDGASGGARRIELGDAFIGRVGVVDVVVGEPLALDLARGGDPKARFWCAIEGSERHQTFQGFGNKGRFGVDLRVSRSYMG
jgi:hypothetical protein